MKKNILFAIYQNGEVIDLSKNQQLPGSDIITFVKCTHKRINKASGNSFYHYSLFNSDFENIDSNSFNFNSYNFCIVPKDKWLPPFPHWSSNYEVRVTVTINSISGNTQTINLNNTYHDGYAFRKLIEIANLAEELGLPVAIQQYKNCI